MDKIGNDALLNIITRLDFQCLLGIRATCHNLNNLVRGVTKLTSASYLDKLSNIFPSLIYLEYFVNEEQLLSPRLMYNLKHLKYLDIILINTKSGYSLDSNERWSLSQRIRRFILKCQDTKINRITFKHMGVYMNIDKLNSSVITNMSSSFMFGLATFDKYYFHCDNDTGIFDTSYFSITWTPWIFKYHDHTWVNLYDHDIDLSIRREDMINVCRSVTRTFIISKRSKVFLEGILRQRVSCDRFTIPILKGNKIDFIINTVLV